MKKCLIIVAILLIQLSAEAQSASEIGKIALSVIIPENVDGLDVSQLSKMQTKITHIISSTGLAAIGYNNNFVIYPKFAIYDTAVVEGGMQNIIVVTCDLSLTIKQVDNNLVFSSVSKTLKGSGSSKKAALTNAISKIATNDEEIYIFINNGKQKILAYYESKCDDIISKSESLVKMQDYAQALSLIMAVPEEVECFKNIQQKSVEIYKAYQNQRCNVQLQSARTHLASSDFNGALRILSEIDPSTVCFNESQSLINIASSKVNDKEKKEWELKMKVYDDNVSLEKHRIDAIKDIASTYYRTKPTTVSYTYLIR